MIRFALVGIVASGCIPLDEVFTDINESRFFQSASITCDPNQRATDWLMRFEAKTTTDVVYVDASFSLGKKDFGPIILGREAPGIWLAEEWEDDLGAICDRDFTFVSFTAENAIGGTDLLIF